MSKGLYTERATAENPVQARKVLGDTPQSGGSFDKMLNKMFGCSVQAFEDKHGKLWLVANHVCALLGTNQKDIPSILDSEEYTTGLAVYGRNIPKGLRRDTRLISESGFYALIFRSRKPGAIQFQDWVCGEVLPSIVRLGCYFMPSVAEEFLAKPDKGIQALLDYKAFRQTQPAPQPQHISQEAADANIIAQGVQMALKILGREEKRNVPPSYIAPAALCCYDADCRALQ